MIELKSVTAGYGNHTVLKDISAFFEKGQLTGIIGVNGCGKSTLLKAMLNLLPLTGGEVTIDGIGTPNLNRREIARKVAYLAQEKNTPDMTVEQMVLHGRFPYLEYPRRYTGQDRQIVQAAMTQMGIESFAAKPLSTLSGGMRQKAYLAMALAQSTDYILLDEPTTFLDIAHQFSLMNTLRELADSGKGIIAVMHDLPMAFAFFDRILLLHDGRVVCYDKPANLCRLGVIEDTFGVSVVPSAEDRGYHYRYPFIEK